MIIYRSISLYIIMLIHFHYDSLHTGMLMGNDTHIVVISQDQMLLICDSCRLTQGYKTASEEWPIILKCLPAIHKEPTADLIQMRQREKSASLDLCARKKKTLHTCTQGQWKDHRSMMVILHHHVSSFECRDFKEDCEVPISFFLLYSSKLACK